MVAAAAFVMQQVRPACVCVCLLCPMAAEAKVACGWPAWRWCPGQSSIMLARFALHGGWPDERAGGRLGGRWSAHGAARHFQLAAPSSMASEGSGRRRPGGKTGRLRSRAAAATNHRLREAAEARAAGKLDCCRANGTFVRAFVPRGKRQKRLLSANTGASPGRQQVLAGRVRGRPSASPAAHSSRGRVPLSRRRLACGRAPAKCCCRHGRADPRPARPPPLPGAQRALCSWPPPGLAEQPPAGLASTRPLEKLAASALAEAGRPPAAPTTRLPRLLQSASRGSRRPSWPAAPQMALDLVPRLLRHLQPARDRSLNSRGTPIFSHQNLSTSSGRLLFGPRA